jgi:signal transduction histidine kinase
MALSDQAARILIVDDDKGLLILMSEALQAKGYDVATAGSGHAALQWLETAAPDLMLLDLKLRDVNASALLERIRGISAPVPFIVVTGQGDERTAVEMMKSGALDYVMKSTALLDLLPGVVKRTLDAVAQERALADAQADRVRLEAEVLAASERERRRIGADLHDGLGQQLTAIELMCAALKMDTEPSHPQAAARLQQISGMLSEVVAQTRSLAHGLYLTRSLAPGGDGSDALKAGLAELAKRTNDLDIRCDFSTRGPVEVPDPAVAGHLYRIAQEATNNAIKHARASRLRIRLTSTKKRLRLEISDNGTGLAKPPADHSGLGLDVMRNRAGMIGAKLTIRSKRGVTILCELPLPS